MEKTPLGSNSTRSVSYDHFGWAFPSSAKSRVDEGRPIAFKTRFFDFPHWGKTKKHPWIEFNEFVIIPPFWEGFTKERKTPGWRKTSNCVENSFFRVSPYGRNEKTPFGSNSTRSVSHHHFGWAFPSSAKSRVDEGRPIAFKTRFLDFSHRSETKKTPLGSNSTRSVSYHHFGWDFPSSAKRRFDVGRPIALKIRFLDFPHWGETKKHPLDRITRGRFHTTIFGGLFPAAQNSGLTKVVQLRLKLVLWRFPIGAKRNNTLGIEFHEVGFIPPFWMGFTKPRKTPGWRRSSNCFPLGASAQRD